MIVKKKDGSWHTPAPPDDTNWQPQTRRYARQVDSGVTPRVDEQILDHLRGSKNAVFKLGEAA